MLSLGPAYTLAGALKITPHSKMLDNQLIIIGTAVIAGIVIMYLLNSCEQDPFPLSVSTPSARFPNADEDTGSEEGSEWDDGFEEAADLKFDWTGDGKITVILDGSNRAVGIEDYIMGAGVLGVEFIPHVGTMTADPDDNDVYPFQFHASYKLTQYPLPTLFFGPPTKLTMVSHAIDEGIEIVQEGSSWKVMVSTEPYPMPKPDGSPNRTATAFTLNGVTKFAIIEQDDDSAWQCYISQSPHPWEEV